MSPAPPVIESISFSGCSLAARPMKMQPMSSERKGWSFTTDTSRTTMAIAATAYRTSSVSLEVYMAGPRLPVRCRTKTPFR